MRLLFTSDWHSDAVTLGVPRREEFRGYVALLREAVVKHDVDIVVFPGDAFDPGSMLHAQHELDVAHAFRDLSREAAMGRLIAVAGNHDIVEVARPLSVLTPLGAVMDRVHVADEPSVFTVGDHGASWEAVTFLLLPYTARAWADAEARGLAGGPAAAMDDAFTRARNAKGLGHRIVVVGHMTVAGAEMGSESVELSRGRDLDLPVGRIKELEPTLVVNGHYHRPQIVKVDGLEIVIPGSPLAFTTDDVSDDKGYVVVDV
jgi:exonuclease SbcD